MDILAAILVFSTALVARLVGYVLAFSRKATGSLTGWKAALCLSATFATGVFFSLLLFFMVQEGIPAWIRTPPFFVGIAAVIEPALAYGSSQIASYLARNRERAGEEMPSRYKCDDGHVVRSRAEALIDNWLRKEGIAHEYEPATTIGGEKIKPDWYLPDADVYIEFWGFLARDNKAYDQRRSHKEKIYASAHKKLVGLTSIDLEDVNTRVKQKLLAFLDENDLARPRRCFNCGAALDARYE